MTTKGGGGFFGMNEDKVIRGNTFLKFTSEKYQQTEVDSLRREKNKYHPLR